MIKSMTGFGKAEFEVNNKKINLELKALNSKQIDINVRIPSVYREKEIELRKVIAERLIRGKIDLTIHVENHGSESNSKINEAILTGYYQHLKKISDSLGLPTDQSTLNSALRLPDVVKAEYETFDEEEWLVITRYLQDALDAIEEFRKQEGKALEADIVANTESILELLNQVAPYEAQRLDIIKGRLTESLNKINP